MIVTDNNTLYNVVLGIGTVHLHSFHGLLVVMVGDSYVPLAEHEDIFWKVGLLGVTTPSVLQCTVFFYAGMNFVLRGIQEQHDLVRDQFTRFPPDFALYDSTVYYKYTVYLQKQSASIY